MNPTGNYHLINNDKSNNRMSYYHKQHGNITNNNINTLSTVLLSHRYTTNIYTSDNVVDKNSGCGRLSRMVSKPMIDSVILKQSIISNIDSNIESNSNNSNYCYSKG